MKKLAEDSYVKAICEYQDCKNEANLFNGLTNLFLCDDCANKLHRTVLEAEQYKYLCEKL